jgi:hypothetical protein
MQKLAVDMAGQANPRRLESTNMVIYSGKMQAFP